MEPKPAAQPSSSADSSSQAEMLTEPALLEGLSSNTDTRRPTEEITEPRSSECTALTESQMQEDQGISAGGTDARIGLSAQGKEVAVSMPLSEEGRAEYVRHLTAKIAAAAQQAALGAVSSSVEVAFCLFHSHFYCSLPSSSVVINYTTQSSSCSAHPFGGGSKAMPEMSTWCLHLSSQQYNARKPASSAWVRELLVLRSSGGLLALQVAGEAVKELPSWAGPDVIMAATMTKLDAIVAAASAQVRLRALCTPVMAGTETLPAFFGPVRLQPFCIGCSGHASKRNCS